MFGRSLRVVVPVALLAAAVACSKDNASTTTTTPTTTVGIPSISSPANGAVIANASQPVTLVVTNATSSASGTTYTFEVSTDVAFVTKTQTKTGVAEGSGTTSVKLDTLLAGTTYFWRAQAVNGTTSGQFSPAAQLTIGSAVSLGQPSPVSPLTGSTTASDKPTFTVINASKSGSAGAVTYKFEVATNTNFNPTLISTSVSEGSGGQTSYTATSALPTGTTLYWRATASDAANLATSTASNVQSFQTASPTAASLIAAAQGVTLWTGTQPPGTAGKASMGPGWGVGTLRDFYGNSFSSPPLEVLRIFDLIDRGMTPDQAISWMQGNGYPTTAVYYDSVKAIGFFAQYMALIGGSWELVLRVGA